MPIPETPLEGRRILVSVLNWGLGHATRSIPLIHALRERGASVHLASDGAALSVLVEAFPDLPAHELPAYNIRYARPPWTVPALILRAPGAFLTMRRERNVIRKLYGEYGFHGILSDNRPGSHLDGVPTVYLTHQLRPPAGIFSPLVHWLHWRRYRHFDEVWVPDSHERVLSGKLSRPFRKTPPVRFIGHLSRLSPCDKGVRKYTWAAVLSGPEPSRTLWEREILAAADVLPERGILVRGLPSGGAEINVNGIDVLNYANSERLREIYAQSELIIARSGYSTLMDMRAMGVRALLVPTPGQSEQHVLARVAGAVPGWLSTDERKVDYVQAVQQIMNMPGPVAQPATLPADLFTIFERKGKS